MKSGWLQCRSMFTAFTRNEVPKSVISLKETWNVVSVNFFFFRYENKYIFLLISGMLVFLSELKTFWDSRQDRCSQLAPFWAVGDETDAPRSWGLEQSDHIFSSCWLANNISRNSKKTTSLFILFFSDSYSGCFNCNEVYCSQVKQRSKDERESWYGWEYNQ